MHVDVFVHFLAEVQWTIPSNIIMANSILLS